MTAERTDRRRFIKRGLIGACGLLLGGKAIRDFSGGKAVPSRPGVGFLHDAPKELGPWAREAAWYEADAGMIRCRLCPHQCLLATVPRP